MWNSPFMCHSPNRRLVLNDCWWLIYCIEHCIGWCIVMLLMFSCSAWNQKSWAHCFKFGEPTGWCSQCMVDVGCLPQRSSIGCCLHGNPTSRQSRQSQDENWSMLSRSVGSQLSHQMASEVGVAIPNIFRNPRSEMWRNVEKHITLTPTLCVFCSRIFKTSVKEEHWCYVHWITTKQRIKQPRAYKFQRCSLMNHFLSFWRPNSPPTQTLNRNDRDSPGANMSLATAPQLVFAKKSQANKPTHQDWAANHQSTMIYWKINRKTIGKWWFNGILWVVDRLPEGFWRLQPSPRHVCRQVATSQLRPPGGIRSQFAFFAEDARLATASACVFCWRKTRWKPMGLHGIAEGIGKPLLGMIFFAMAFCPLYKSIHWIGGWTSLKPSSAQQMNISDSDERFYHDRALPQVPWSVFLIKSLVLLIRHV